MDIFDRKLDNDWWKTLFNENYLLTDGDIVENEINTKEDVDTLINIIEVGKEDRILDVCCGQGRHCIEFHKRGFTNILGVDFSSYLVNLALTRSEGNIPFVLGDISEQSILPKINKYFTQYHLAYIMGNSFGYFSDPSKDLEVLKNINKCLISGGKIALDITDGVWAINNFIPRSFEKLDSMYYVIRERQLSLSTGRVISKESLMNDVCSTVCEQYYAERLYSEVDIYDIFDRSGFVLDSTHTIDTKSTRNEDLGLMAKRILYVGRKR